MLCKLNLLNFPCTGHESGPFNALGQDIHLHVIPLADARALCTQLGFLDSFDKDSELHEDRS